MNANNLFPSEYLKADDLGNQGRVVTIDHLGFVDVGNPKVRKPILFFVGVQKGMILNKTNANMISALLGSETEGWKGKKIELYSTTVDFQGRSTQAIRVRASTAETTAKPLLDGAVWDTSGPSSEF